MTKMNRRQLLTWSGAAVGVTAVGAAGMQAWSGDDPAALPPPVSGLPPRQHAWDSVMARDEHGNTKAARVPARADRSLSLLPERREALL